MAMILTEIEGYPREIPSGTVLRRLAEEYQRKKRAKIVLAEVDGRRKELFQTVTRPCRIRFVTLEEADGIRAYERSAQLLMNRAIYDVIPLDKLQKVRTEFSVTGGLFVRMWGDFTLDEQLLGKIRRRMRHLADQDLKIEKSEMSIDDAERFFEKVKMFDKEKLFRYHRASRVSIYAIGGYADYYYGAMVPSTGYLQWFELELYRDGFVLRLPDKVHYNSAAPFVPHEKLFQIMEDTTRWGEKMQMATVGDINAMIAGGHISDMILIAEARQEKQIADIAQQIADDPRKRFVLIAGPSSSGKTSFSHRLAIQLMALGRNPHPVGTDDYFVDREKNPRDENGNYDYEALECVDIAQFNADMNALLRGETVPMPTFNFVQGRREYKGDTLTLGPDDILIIEGIHSLNEKMSEFIPAENKFRIYISALTQLNIDEHNRIPTTDGRLIRRMIRDARTRGASAQDTIARWASVRRGEERNIFPYQESADVMFNSSLIYEFSVMKSYAEQLLFGIPTDAPEYPDAKRLLQFFDYFLAVDSNQIPANSLIKEFIGGSVFRV